MADYNPKTLVLEKDSNTYGYASGPFYAECSTDAETKIKVVEIPEIKELNAGLSVRIKFTYGQSDNGQPKLKINSLTAKNICRNGTVAAAQHEWRPGEILDFVYDGTNFIILEGAIPTTTYYGSRIKLSSSTFSTSEDLAATPKAIKTTYDFASGKANRDEIGIVITGNKASKNVISGQYVSVQNSTISDISDGLYKALSNVSAGTAFTSANLTAVANGGLNALNDQIETLNTDVAGKTGQIETLNNHFNPSLGSPAYINTSIPLNSIGRSTFTGSSNDPLPDGSTSGTMLANFIRFGSGSATNQRYGTLILNNSGETYVKARSTDNAPYGTWKKVLYEEPFVQTKSYSCKYSLSAGSAKNISGTDLDVSTPTGYTPFAVLQFSSGTNAVMPRLVNGKSTGSNAVMSLYNTGSSAVSDVSASIVIAYIKTSLISIN